MFFQRWKNSINLHHSLGSERIYLLWLNLRLYRSDVLLLLYLKNLLRLLNILWVNHLRFLSIWQLNRFIDIRCHIYTTPRHLGGNQMRTHVLHDDFFREELLHACIRWINIQIHAFALKLFQKGILSFKIAIVNWCRARPVLWIY